MNTGIGVVLAAIYVRQVIDLPQLKNERERIVREKQNDSGFVEDAAEGVAPPTTADTQSARAIFPECPSGDFMSRMNRLSGGPS